MQKKKCHPDGISLLAEHYGSTDSSKICGNTPPTASAPCQLGNWFWLSPKPAVQGHSRRASARNCRLVEPRIHCGIRTPKRNAIRMEGISFWSRVRESNPPPRLGKPLYYRCTNPAYKLVYRATRGSTGILRQQSWLRVPAHFLLAVPKTAMPCIAAVYRRQNACDRTRLRGLGSRCTTDVRTLRFSSLVS